MITVENNTTNPENIYLETPTSWDNVVYDMIDEIDSLLQLYKLPSHTISYDQIKEKPTNNLRVYWCLPIELEEHEELTDEQRLFYRCLNGMISAIVEKYEKLIKLKIEKGLL